MPKFNEKPKTQSVFFRLPVAKVEELKKQADDLGVTVSDLLKYRFYWAQKMLKKVPKFELPDSKQEIKKVNSTSDIKLKSVK